MQELAEALDWDNDKQVGYMEFVQLMQAEAVESAHGGGGEAKRSDDAGDRGVDRGQGRDMGGARGGGETKSAVEFFEGAPRKSLGPQDMVAISLSTLRITLPLQAARKVKKVRWFARCYPAPGGLLLTRLDTNGGTKKKKQTQQM